MGSEQKWQLCFRFWHIERTKAIFIFNYFLLNLIKEFLELLGFLLKRQI